MVKVIHEQICELCSGDQTLKRHLYNLRYGDYLSVRSKADTDDQKNLGLKISSDISRDISWRILALLRMFRLVAARNNPLQLFRVE